MEIRFLDLIFDTQERKVMLYDLFQYTGRMQGCFCRQQHLWVLIKVQFFTVHDDNDRIYELDELPSIPIWRT